MKTGEPEEDDIVWVVVCQHPNYPDGPAKFIGPYSAVEYAEADVKGARTSFAGKCSNTHYIGHQKWSDIQDHVSHSSYLDWKWESKVSL